MKKWILLIVILISLSVGYASEVAGVFDKILKDGSVASSYLIESELPKDFYSVNKAFDGNKDTCWCKGVKGDGVGQYIWFDLMNGSLESYRKYLDKKLIITLDITNGVAKDVKLFNENNRIRRITIEVYEAEVSASQMHGVVRDQEPLLNSRIDIELKDDPSPQRVVLELTPKSQLQGSEFSRFMFIGKLIIKEIYKGEKYSDTCISEIKVHPIE